MDEKQFLENTLSVLKETLKNVEKLKNIDHERLNQSIIETNRRIRELGKEGEPKKQEEPKCECKTISFEIEAGLKWCDEHDRFVSAYSP